MNKKTYSNKKIQYKKYLISKKYLFIIAILIILIALYMYINNLNLSSILNNLYENLLNTLSLFLPITPTNTQTNVNLLDNLPTTTDVHSKAYIEEILKPLYYPYIKNPTTTQKTINPLMSYDYPTTPHTRTNPLNVYTYPTTPHVQTEQNENIQYPTSAIDSRPYRTATPTKQLNSEEQNCLNKYNKCICYNNIMTKLYLLYVDDPEKVENTLKMHPEILLNTLIWPKIINIIDKSNQQEINEHIKQAILVCHPDKVKVKDENMKNFSNVISNITREIRAALRKQR